MPQLYLAPITPEVSLIILINVRWSHIGDTSGLKNIRTEGKGLETLPALTLTGREKNLAGLPPFEMVP